MQKCKMSAKRLHFTELALSRMSTPGVYYDTNIRAFGCRIGKHSRTLFVVKNGGHRVTLGRFPELDLKTARRRAQEVLFEAPVQMPAIL